jgi:hypothetical protein
MFHNRNHIAAKLDTVNSFQVTTRFKHPAHISIINVSTTQQAVSLLACIQEALVSNLGLDTDNPD